MGIKTAILDPLGDESPAGQVADISIKGSCMLRDASEAKARELAAVSNVVTIEIEHVDSESKVKSTVSNINSFHPLSFFLFQ